MNYKIRVKNEVESKEAQGLLELLGFEKQVWGFFPRGKYFIFANANYYSRDSVINFSECDYRELTTQELLDLVVLNRNSIDDATHACDYPSGLGVKLSGVWYAYNYNEKKWELWVDDSEYKVRDFKPIEKKQMSDEATHIDEDGDYWKDVKFNADGEAYYGGFLRNGIWLQSGIGKLKLKPIKESLNDQYAEIEKVREKHSHYKKDISHLDTLDIYRVTELFKPHSCGAHIAKKALCSGQRGHKDLLTDIQDIIDTAERWKQMLIEDENSRKD